MAIDELNSMVQSDDFKSAEPALQKQALRGFYKTNISTDPEFIKADQATRNQSYQGFLNTYLPKEEAPKKGIVKKAIDAVENFAKDPIGNIIGKRESKPQAVKEKPKVTPTATHDPYFAVASKGQSTPDFLHPQSKYSNPLSQEILHPKLETDPSKIKHKNYDSLDTQLKDAPLEDDTLNIAGPLVGMTRQAVGAVTNIAGKALKSKEMATEGAKSMVKGAAFTAGDVTGQGAGVLASEVVDESLSDEFKKEHPNWAMGLQVGAGLVGGIAAGIGAENRALQRGQEYLNAQKMIEDSAKNLGIDLPKTQSPEVIAKDKTVAEALNKEYAPAHADVPKAPAENPPADFVDDINVGHKVEEVDPRIAEAAHKADVETISSHPRLQELIDMRRDVSAKDSARPNIRSTDRQIIHENNGNVYETTVIPAMDTKNYNHDFALTQADIKAYEKNGITPTLAEKFKKDLDVLDNDPMWRKVDEPSGRVEGDTYIDEFGNEEAIPVSRTKEVDNDWTAARDEWHQDSHALTKNEDGTPKIFYHGTTANFESFRPSESRLSDDATSMFTDNPNIADNYNYDPEKTGSNTIPVHLNIKNPKVINGNSKNISAQISSAKAKGHDGVIIQNHNGVDNNLRRLNNPNTPDGEILNSNTYISFDPTQIKSIHNNGSFDLKNPNILMSKGEDAINPHTLETMSESLDTALGQPLAQKLSPIMATINKADIPEVVLAKANNNPDGIHGFVYEGKAYIVADNIPKEWSEQQVRGLVMHEVGVHLRKAGDVEAFDRITARVKALADNNDKRVQEAYANVPKDTEAHLIDEEALGYLVQHHPEMGVVKQLIAWARATLRKMGFEYESLALNTDDLVAMAWGAVKRGDGAVVSKDTMFMAPFGKDAKIGELTGIPQELEKFGKNYAKYKSDPKGAIDHLIKVQRGQVRGALYHPEIGEIDVAWGKVTDTVEHEGYGLSHIIDKHGEAVARRLDDIVMGGKVTRQKGNSVEIVNDEYMAVIKLDWYGKEKQWVVTTFDMPPHQSITDDVVSGGKSGNLSPQAHDEIIHPTNDESQDVLFSRTQTPEESAGGFYHKMDQVLNEKMANRSTPEAIMGMLRNNGIKEDEITWSRIDSILKNEIGEDGKIGKADLIEAINEMRPRFENVSYGKEYQQYSTRKTHGDTGAPDNYNVNVTTVEKTGGKYSDSHWKNTTNELLHTRTDDAMIDGQKTLLIEEIQSTRHQAGRKEGYGKDGIAAAPLSKTWHEYGMRQIIDEAVKKGYERVAWVDGATHGARSGLAQDIDKLVYNKNYGVIAGYKDGEEVFYRSVTDEELDAMLGKDPTRNLRSNEISPNIYAIEGELLKIGGEGMKGFYDKILVDYAKKYTKKYGISVEKKTLSNGTEVWSFPVNTKMKEDISKNGQALYSNGIGAMAGVGRDDEGNITFDPTRALLGVAGFSVVASKTVRTSLSKFIGKTEHLSDSAIRGIVSATIKATDKVTIGKAAKLMDSIANSNTVDDMIGHKIYKMKDYMALRESSQRAVNAAMESAARLHLQLVELSSEAREATYRYMTGEKGIVLSPEIKLFADTFITKVDNMGKEMVDNGFLTKEAYEEWKGQYLHRRYASKIKGVNDWKSGKGEFTVDSIKMRGKTWDAGEEEYQALLKNGDIGEISKGKIEVLQGSDGKYKLRRDWTKEERTSMGEITDIAYSLPETIGRMAQMIEYGKMLKQVPEKYLFDVAKAKTLSEKSLKGLGYVKLDGSKYGALNGRWVNRSIAEDIRGVHNDVFGIDSDTLGKAWQSYIRSIKMSHTIYNPTAHVNNTLSNIVLQTGAGLNPLKSINYAKDGALANIKHSRFQELDAKRVAGLSDAEAKELSAIEADEDFILFQSLSDRGMFGRSNLNEMLTDYMSPTVKQEATTAIGKVSKKAFVDNPQKLYQAEDDIMRFGAVKQLMRDGLWDTVEEGGKKVFKERKMSIDEAMDYVNSDIVPDYTKPMSKWARNLRDSGVMPFMSWTYHSTPVLYNQLKKHPVRFLAIMGGWTATDFGFGINPFSDDDMPEKMAATSMVIGRDGNKVTTARVSSMIPQAQIMPWNVADTYLEPILSMGVAGGITSAYHNYNPYFEDKITHKKGVEGAYQQGKNVVQNVLPTPDVIDKVWNLTESKVFTDEQRKRNKVFLPRTPTQEAVSFVVNTRTYDLAEHHKVQRGEERSIEKANKKSSKKWDSGIKKLEKVFQ